MCDWGWGHNGMAGWGGIGWILMAVFWIAVIGLIVWAVVRLSHGNRGPAQQGETPRGRSSIGGSPAVRSTRTPMRRHVGASPNSDRADDQPCAGSTGTSARARGGRARAADLHRVGHRGHRGHRGTRWHGDAVGSDDVRPCGGHDAHGSMAAVMMSQQLLVRGDIEQQELVGFARTVRDAQHAEIFQMRRYLGAWFGGGRGPMANGSRITPGGFSDTCGRSGPWGPGGMMGW